MQSNEKNESNENANGIMGCCSRSGEEKSGGCGDRRDARGFGTLLVWGALVLIANAIGAKSVISWWDGWAVFFAGAGMLVLAGTALKYLGSGQSRGKTVGGLICGMVLLGFGIGEAVPWYWAVVLAVVGLSVLFGSFTDRRRRGQDEI
jgi:hypothetical protein